MKIKPRILGHKNKLIELQILKSKIYKIPINKKKIENSKIKLYFKKIAHIIYEYHISNKTILFVNFPSKLENNIISLRKTTKHIFISKENWVNGFLTNKSVNMYSKLIPNYNKKNFVFFDLIVIFNPTNNHIFNESYNSYIPTILITDELFNRQLPLLKQSYKILGYLKFIEEQINNNFFFSLLQSILKQATIKKKTQQYRNANHKLILKRKKRNFKKYKKFFKKKSKASK
jgi:hypothetical protein